MLCTNYRNYQSRVRAGARTSARMCKAMSRNKTPAGDAWTRSYGRILQHLMGHSDIKVTLDTYADVFDNFQSISVEKADSYLTKVGLAV